MHSNWMYSFIIRDMNDWNIFMESGLIDNAIKAIDKGKKTYVYPWQMRFLVRLVKVIPQNIIDLFIGDSNKYYK